MKKTILECVFKPITNQNMVMLFLRLFVGCMMLTHGLAKLYNFEAMSAAFPDPIGLGSTLSLVLMIFAEVGCSLLLIFGIFTRLATLPLIFGMCVAIFVFHANDPFQMKEPAVLYLGIYIVLLLAGGGRFSVDHLIYGKIGHKI